MDAAGLNTLKVRQRMSEILRGLPGSSLVNAPADTDLIGYIPKLREERRSALPGTKSPLRRA